MTDAMTITVHPLVLTFFLQIGNSSVIELLAQVGHHNSSLSCIAFNPLLPDTVARDSVKIYIHCE